MKDECWKMSAALNPKIDKRSSSVSADSHGSKLITRDESGIPVTRILCEVKSMCGSNAGESVASMVGSSLRSLDATMCSGSKARGLQELSPGCGLTTDLGHFCQGDQERSPRSRIWQ